MIDHPILGGGVKEIVCLKFRNMFVFRRALFVSLRFASYHGKAFIIEGVVLGFLELCAFCEADEEASFLQRTKKPLNLFEAPKRELLMPLSIGVMDPVPSVKNILITFGVEPIMHLLQNECFFQADVLDQRGWKDKGCSLTK